MPPAAGVTGQGRMPTVAATRRTRCAVECDADDPDDQPDSGDGPVRFEVHRPAGPCAWMDAVIAPGAFKALRGKGGVRCVPLDDGVLYAGKAVSAIVGA
ncbi:hypothetical protein [Lentzea sp.]|uniref:hypothetical protein n=1 Tax=Lentzea sp. TaxID=56099 RepID=UPI002BD32D94|nr:hypothetical protein [Lentzea sp.]HUQ59979.1 hypothetical protein [Lentzea sp.]